MPRKSFVRGMFDSISSDYDRLNHIMSFGIDRTWRKRALKKILDCERPLKILDLACGTGDFAIAMARRMKSGHVTAADISEGMLSVMRGKVGSEGLSDRITIEVGDGEALTYPDDSFDRVTIAFGIRNFENKSKGLSEMLRVLSPGGRLVILELSRPERPLARFFYDLYAGKLIPAIGGAISGDKPAYKYLPASIARFPGKKEFMAMMSSAGFVNVTHKAFTFGICRMYTGLKPE